MKKLYKQPQTESLELMGERLCQEMIVGSGGNSVHDKWGNAPTRRGNPAAILYI